MKMVTFISIVALILVLIAGFCIVGCGFGDFDLEPISDETAPAEGDGSTVVPPEKAKDVSVDPEFWLSDTGVLHNSLCRWYKDCQGSTWDGTSEHTNCGTCGGDSPIVREWNLPDWKNK